MGYIPYTASYNPSIRTPAFVAAETARLNARRSAVQQIMAGGNQLMGGLVTDCCSDPAYGRQSFYDPNLAVDATSALAALTAVPGSSGGSGNPGGSGSRGSNSGGSGGGSSGSGNPFAFSGGGPIGSPVLNWPLTPVDLITGTNGFRLRRDGRPWPRPLLPMSERRRRINAYPNYNPASIEVSSSLVPPCPCLSNAAPIPIAVPAPVAAPVCPPGYAPNNHGMCDKFQAGVSGLGQVDLSGGGGFLAILGLFGIVVWATRK